ncbi:hypothetical protein ACFLXP_03210 [Chloroflexota bacterium]
MLKIIIDELKSHIPFTAVGAVSGIIVILIIIWTNSLSQISQISYAIFYILHPGHIILSAMVTTAIYKRYAKKNIGVILLVGYLGAIVVATLSDSLIPYLQEVILDLPNRSAHIGFIEEWWIVNPAALFGVALGYWKPFTKFPHSGHVLISTWASLFHIIMALGATVNWVVLVATFFFLFLGVWLPCCLSDIIFPLLLTGKNLPHSHK